MFLPKNLLFRDEVIPISEYIDKFYPFEKPVFKIENKKPAYPPGMAMPTLKQYGEQYEWLGCVVKNNFDYRIYINCDWADKAEADQIFQDWADSL